MPLLKTSITIDITSNNNGTYDTYISTEDSSGEHYRDINAEKIGEYTADLIDTLEEAYSNKSYLSDRGDCRRKFCDPAMRVINNLRAENEELKKKLSADTKPCPACNFEHDCGKTINTQGDNFIIMQHTNDDGSITNSINTDEKHFYTLDIAFCPICGRKLETAVQKTDV